MFGWLKRRSKVKTETYSVEMQSTGRECVDVIYKENGRKLHFGGEKVGKKWGQVNLAVPTNLALVDQARVLANLGAGVQELGYEYLIFRVGQPEPIPEREQQAALAGLRELGLQPEVAPGKSTVKLSKLPGWEKPANVDPKEQARRMSSLVSTLRGKRSPIEILAKSPSAEVDFV